MHRLTFDRQAPQQPLLIARKIPPRLNRTPVVPDHQIADLPLTLEDNR
jgi:hypothetical protein